MQTCFYSQNLGTLFDRSKLKHSLNLQLQRNDCLSSSDVCQTTCLPFLQRPSSCYQGDLDWVMTILDTLPPHRLLYMPKELVYFKSGGFSDQTIYHQLQEHLQLIYQRYGLFMIIYRVPRLLRRYLGKWGRKWLGISTFRFWQ